MGILENLAGYTIIIKSNNADKEMCTPVHFKGLYIEIHCLYFAFSLTAIFFSFLSPVSLLYSCSISC